MLKGFFATRPSVVIVGGVLTILAAGLGTTAPAHAQETMTRTERVSYADLNLGTSAGRMTLQGRIKRAVKRVCTPEGSAMILAMRTRQRCQVASMNDALAQMRRAVQYAELADRS